MRELIRPALFLVARLGLFLSIVAWAASQTTNVLGNAVVFIPLQFTIDETGYAMADDPFPASWSIRARRYLALWQIRSTWARFHEPSFSAPGIWIDAHNLNTEWAIAVYHWLVVTSFALFYGVLKWVYWEHATEVKPDE